MKLIIVLKDRDREVLEDVSNVLIHNGFFCVEDYNGLCTYFNIDNVIEAKEYSNDG